MATVCVKPINEDDYNNLVNGDKIAIKDKNSNAYTVQTIEADNKPQFAEGHMYVQVDIHVCVHVCTS